MGSIVVQPPARTQTCRTIYPPVVAQISVRAGGRHDNTHLFATAVLLDDQDRVINGQLGSALTATGYTVKDRGSGSERHQDVAFVFPSLTLSYAGVFSVRVDIYRVNYYNGDSTTMIDQAETKQFHAVRKTVEVQAPSSDESAVLQKLIQSGCIIPEMPT